MKNFPPFRMPPEIPDIGDPELAHLARLIRNPLSGLVYRRRFDMVLSLIDGRPSELLEIGYGAGFFSYNLAPQVDRYLGIDIHPHGDRVADSLANMGIDNFEYLQADARRLEMIKDDSFDIVVSVSCLEHIKESEQVQREVVRVLRSGGQAVYGVPVKNIFTKFLFRLIGYDDKIIHPTNPRGILETACSCGLTLEASKIFPNWSGFSTGLYWAARFRKED